MKAFEYLAELGVPSELLTTTAGRKLLTRDDPMLFAIVYELPHLIRPGDGEASIAQFHIDICEYAQSWLTNEGSRDCWIAPRNSGKSTWLFTLLPLWAAAHGHKKFIAAFSDSEDQASGHLRTFKSELDNNELLKKDYPELCRPMMAGAVKRYISQSNTMIQQANGFSFSAKGIDSKSLGLKIGNTRPDLILLDDIEPTESNYSPHLAETRKRTMLDGVFMLNDRATIVIVGTTVMSNSIIDQLRKVGEYRTTWGSTNRQREVDSDIESHKQGEDECTDNNYYVNHCEGNLSSDEGEISTSYPSESIGVSVSHSLTDIDNKSVLDEIEGTDSISQNDVSTQIGRALSNGTKLSIVGDSDTQSLSLQELTSADSGECLTKAGDHDSCPAENDLKSNAPFHTSSIPNSHIRDFAELEAQQLALLQDAPVPNKGESVLDEKQIESVSFYDSLDQELQWVVDERINVHYYPAVVIDVDGTESSWWPEYKPLDELDKIRHTRSFAMNYMNRPVNVDASYWLESDIQIAECAEGYKYTLISVDPAVSTKQSNDYTALTVISLGNDGLVYVRHAEQVRIVSTALRDRVNELIETFDAQLVLCETNQGGMLWSSVFDGITANYKGIHQTEPKPVRAGRALDYYRKDKVRHTRHFTELEEQMYSYPKVAHDDLLDSMGAGVHYFLSFSNRPRVRKRSYI
ncbi:hypothetical protein [Rhodococcus sp. JG-3]|uniref:phage terminase large subunit family protein n=1 Tax=Rhodococcus sp. JG-3 TaxID=1305835 RepID=UPI000424D7F8|nr:hypothetical protein [Rhodococcus sp. JG-3]